MIYGDTLISS